MLGGRELDQRRCVELERGTDEREESGENTVERIREDGRKVKRKEWLGGKCADTHVVCRDSYIWKVIRGVHHLALVL